MGDLVEVPPQLPGPVVQRHDGAGVQVITRSNTAIEVGRGIAGGEDHESAFEIDRGRLPDTAATPLPRICVFGAVRLFTRDVPVQPHTEGVRFPPLPPPPTFVRPRNDIQPPYLCPRPCSEPSNEPPNPLFPPTSTRQDLA